MTTSRKTTNSTSSSQSDVIIVGGGMAGASMAAALAPLGIMITIIEAHDYKVKESQPSFDDRCIALSLGSSNIYRATGLWHDIETARQPLCEAIKKIHVSDKGGMGTVRLDAKEANVPAFGYVVESRGLGEVLYNKIKSYQNIRIIAPASITRINPENDYVTVDVQEENSSKAHQLTSRLLIIADGVNSSCRKLLGIEANIRDYKQTAVIANIQTRLPHQGVAYERFTDTGPLAVLPLTKDRCSLVWTTNTAQAPEIMALDDAAFIQQLTQRFGTRLGKITRTGKRFAYPLSLMRVEQGQLESLPRIALIGNAAHGVHPVAGQGFNLGLRDIAALTELVAEDRKCSDTPDPGNATLLKNFRQWRKADIKQVSRITDTLVKVFSNSSVMLALLRDSGLVAMDLLPFAKNMMIKEAMGMGLLQGRLSKMSVGRSVYN